MINKADLLNNTANNKATSKKLNEAKKLIKFEPLNIILSGLRIELPKAKKSIKYRKAHINKRKQIAKLVKPILKFDKIYSSNMLRMEDGGWNLIFALDNLYSAKKISKKELKNFKKPKIRSFTKIAKICKVNINTVYSVKNKLLNSHDHQTIHY